MSKKEMFEGFDMTEIEAHKKKYAEETKIWRLRCLQGKYEKNFKVYKRGLG